jgi:glycerol uptake facilitator-like aquaporin
VVGSGIMADRLSDDVAVSLIGNTLPTGAILVVLITTLGPVSGAHFNPAVTLVFALRREIGANVALAYTAAQVAGGVAGTLLTHAMFELPIFQLASTVRSGAGQWIAAGWSASTSPPPTGSQPRLRSPTRRSHCSRAIGHLRGHPRGRPTGLHRCRIRGSADRYGLRGLAARRAETD